MTISGEITPVNTAKNIILESSQKYANGLSFALYEVN
jgi:hypothetical protein